MIYSKHIHAFTRRFPLVGQLCWIASMQFFIVQYFVSKSNPNPYSLSFNTISDLGNRACAYYGERYVCSPEHALMNMSFITLGLTMVAGSLLLYHQMRRDRGMALGFSLMALAGIGTILVGIYPENSNATMHTLGAALPFLLGNIALIVFGLALSIPQWFRVYSVLSGIVALVALKLFLTHHYFALGEGGMERLVAHPQTIWLIVFGLFGLYSHKKQQSAKQ